MTILTFFTTVCRLVSSRIDIHAFLTDTVTFLLLSAFIIGILTVTPAAGSASTAEWQVGLPVPRFFLPEAPTGVENGTLDAVLNANTAFAPTPILVVPGAQTEIIIEYTIDGHEHTYTHNLSSNGNWEMGYKYTYNYTINVNEIIFDCNVKPWEPVEGGSVTI